MLKVSDAIQSRLTDVVEAGENENESMAEHIYTRLLGLDAFVSSPIIGVGPGVNASPWYSETYQAEWAGSHSHHINMLGETGFLGAGLEWIIMFWVARYMWRGLFVGRKNTPERNLLAGLLAAYITIIFGNLFYFYYLNDFVWFLMACGVALSRAIILKEKKESRVCAEAAQVNQVRI
jgi:O-antigen ligase